MLQWVRGRISSPTLLTTVPDFPACSRCKGRVVRSKVDIFPLPLLPHARPWGIALALSPIQGQLTSTPDGRDSSTVPLWGGTGPTFQSGTFGEGQGQLCATLSSLLSMVMEAMDSNTDSSCGRSPDADMAPGSRPDPDETPWSWVAAPVTEIAMDPTALWRLKLYVAPGVGPYPGHLHCL